MRQKLDAEEPVHGRDPAADADPGATVDLAGDAGQPRAPGSGLLDLSQLRISQDFSATAGVKTAKGQ